MVLCNRGDYNRLNDLSQENEPMDRSHLLSVCNRSARRFQAIRLISACLVLGACGSDAMAFAGKATSDVLKGTKAFGDWRQDKPGLRRLISPDDLPPISTQSIGQATVVAGLAGSKPEVPEGFVVEQVATAVNPRVIRTAPNGDLFVSDTMSGLVRIYRVPEGRARPSEESVFASGIRQPFGIAFYPAGPNPSWVYIAGSDRVLRYPYSNGDLKARGPAQTILSSIPFQHHYTRDIVLAPDGKRIYLSIGSGSNVALDMSPEPRFAVFPEVRPIAGLEEWKTSMPLGAAWDTEELRAQVLSFAPDGQDLRTVATGLRNCTGMTIQPATDDLWCAVNERDGLGDDGPFEYATRVQEGAFYGWPWFYIGGNEDPNQAGARPDLKNQVTIPDVLMQAHSAPIQMSFYSGKAFPAAYKGNAFVSLHGSWNRAKRTGYKVVRLLFDANVKATGAYEDFMTGFVLSDETVWGRPTGITEAKDGSLFVAEDGNGAIWRISYPGSAAR
jgi:glucose/arabinose dehydrogenase